MRAIAACAPCGHAFLAGDSGGFRARSTAAVPLPSRVRPAAPSGLVSAEACTVHDGARCCSACSGVRIRRALRRLQTYLPHVNRDGVRSQLPLTSTHFFQNSDRRIGSRCARSKILGKRVVSHFPLVF